MRSDEFRGILCDYPLKRHRYLGCAVLILVGMRVSPSFRRKVCPWGRLGVLHLGLEYHLAILDPPPSISDLLTYKLGTREALLGVDDCLHTQ